MPKSYNDKYVFSKFQKWYNYAEVCYKANQLNHFNAFILSTINNDSPDSRIVLLKDFSPNGFVFYTNYNSQKGKQISINNKVTLLFFWSVINRQVRIYGSAEKVSVDTSNKYFASRPYLSKIGAWASQQSQPMASSLQLYQDIAKYSIKYSKDVPRPNHWGGYIVKPYYMEFWREKNSRLHLRESFSKTKNDNWEKETLYP